jgi:cytochrome c peroxidase
MVVMVACTGASDADPDLGPRPPATNRATVAPGHDINPRLLRRFRPLRAVFDDHGVTPDAARVSLGRTLYNDPRLSATGKVSCATCHPLASYGADHAPVSTGVEGQSGTRNAPSVYNAAGEVAQFWDGRAATVEAQAKGPILNPVEMAMSDGAAVEDVLRSIPGYRPMFATAFPADAEPITFDNAARAIGAFERTLATPSRWDRFLAGDAAALTRPELDGLKLFADVGCIGCHTGELVGGSMFQRVGVVAPWPDQRDPGRYALTHVETDRMTFKVPSLRNVAMTAPYFHDGSVVGLDDAVRMMAHHQLGEDLSDDDVGAIVGWLGTLTGPLSDEAMSVPVLPPDLPVTTNLEGGGG